MVRTCCNLTKMTLGNELKDVMFGDPIGQSMPRDLKTAGRCY